SADFSLREGGGRARTPTDIRMRLPRAEEDRLARLQPDKVEYKRTERAYVAGELLVAPQDEVHNVAPGVACDSAARRG
ncbi:hypothetical protein H0H87_000869, partial [Tephrocybe sp. NHM501043]